MSVADYDYAYEPDDEYLRKTVHYQAQKLVEGKPAEFRKGIEDAARFFAERGANDTMHALTKRDARKLGREVRFARVPTGPTTCPWCLMLASRGFVYWSAKTAGEANKFHRNCDCRILPGYSDDASVEGYDPSELYTQWKDSGFMPTNSGSRISSTTRRARSSGQKSSASDAYHMFYDRIESATDIDQLREIMQAANAQIGSFSDRQIQGLQWALERARDRVSKRQADT